MTLQRVMAAGFWITAATAGAASGEGQSGFNPIPKLLKVPANVSVAWLQHVYEDPQKFGLEEWVTKKTDLTDSGRLAYSVDFTSTYPIDKKRLRTSAQGLKVDWINPRVQQLLSLDLWKEEPSGELKKESPWILPGRLTWTLVNFIYECAVPGRIYRVDLVTIDAHTLRQLERRMDNEMLEMDFTNSWDGVCNAKSP